ncbi:hypothetical protein BDZ91DRAFT_731682 [Kalaharituber pfeilii]|nr:hypothetical protein BDZ91DRAFT_731682 [Kalaharituber pfeilii]
MSRPAEPSKDSKDSKGSNDASTSDDVLDKELLAGLDKEELEYKKDAEISRILNAFKLDALQPGVTENDVKIQFRKKSLLIHPDKTKNPQAPDAFDRLKKAESALMDEKTRQRLDEAFADARMLLIRNANGQEKTKQVLIENELRRRKQIKAQLAEEGREQRKQEMEAEARKRKRESEQAWEETREQRINSWRTFQKSAVEKKKKKQKPLG